MLIDKVPAVIKVSGTDVDVVRPLVVALLTTQRLMEMVLYDLGEDSADGNAKFRCRHLLLIVDKPMPKVPSPCIPDMGG